MPTKEERLVEMNSWFKLAEEAQTLWRKQAEKDMNYYLGKQWDNADLEILKQQKRPALTFNHILPLINLVSGYQRQNRQDAKVYNKRGGTREVAEIFTAIIKDIMNNSNGDFETSMKFLVGIIAGKAYLDVHLDYDYDIYNGEVKVEYISPFKVYTDPYHERYDLSDASYIFKCPWLPKKKIELIYPEKKKELAELTVDEDDRLVLGQSDYARHDTYSTGEGSSGKSVVSEKDKYKYRVKECWWREFETQNFLYSLQSGKAARTELSAEKINAILQRSPSLRKIKRVIPKMHLTTYVGNVILQDIIPFEDKGGLKRFPLIPFYAYWLEGNYFSMVTQLKDPQQEINKRYSQLLHHLNMSANSGWIGEAKAVKDWDKLEQMGSKPGLTVKVKAHPQKGIEGNLQRIEPARLSEGHLILAKEGATQIKSVSGINPDLLGMASEKVTSGIAMQLRQRQGIVGLEPILDNFRISRQQLGKVLIEFIQKSGAYSREEILNLIVDGEEKEFGINQKKGFWVTKIVNDTSVGEYDCVVSQQPSNPTTRLANFYSLLEAAKILPIPPVSLFKASDIPDKDEIIEEITKQQQAQQEAAKHEIDMKHEEMNIKKTELAIKAKEVEIKGNTELAKAEEGKGK